MKKFVVIGGAPRSGTNLLRRIVGSHSQIGIPPGEFQLFNQIAAGKTTKQILQNERLEKWGIDFASHYDEFPSVAFVSILEKYAQKIGKSIPGEKTPFNEFYYADLLTALRDYDHRFIHLVRNPFDVAASYKHMGSMKGKKNLNDISTHLRNWIDSATLGLHHSRENPAQYAFVRYEDLLNDPDKITKNLCDFIGIKYEAERMLSMADFAGHRDNTSFADRRAPESAPRAEIKPYVSRKSHLSGQEIREIARYCGAKALEVGYEDPDFSSYQRSSSPRKRISALFRR